MESITIKVDKDIGKRIEQAMKSGYSTKTEFIRDAIRKSLTQVEREKLKEEFIKFYGKAKKKVSDKQLEKIRDEIFEEYAKEKGWN